MGFMFCDLHVSLKLPLIGDINSTNLSFFLGGGCFFYISVDIDIYIIETLR